MGNTVAIVFIIGVATITLGGKQEMKSVSIIRLNSLRDFIMAIKNGNLICAFCKSVLIDDIGQEDR